MNVSQSVIVLFMTGLLFVLLSIVVTALHDQINNVANIKFLVILCVMILWSQIIFLGDLYINLQKVTDDLKNYEKLQHGKIMKNYIERTSASCPSTTNV
jgi:predicted PurR-regulated permease PerM